MACHREATVDRAVGAADSVGATRDMVQTVPGTVGVTVAGLMVAVAVTAKAAAVLVATRVKAKRAASRVAVARVVAYQEAVEPGAVGDWVAEGPAAAGGRAARAAAAALTAGLRATWACSEAPQGAAMWAVVALRAAVRMVAARSAEWVAAVRARRPLLGRASGAG